MSDLFSLDIANIIAVQVFLEIKKSRLFVGKLSQKTKKETLYFRFQYDPLYMSNPFAIPVGPELLLTSEEYESPILFPSFQDRIPSTENIAYADYCNIMGISEQEQNPLVLLSTIGRKGPSSFIFAPLFKEDFSIEDLKAYQKQLELTTEEFSVLFDTPLLTLQKMESKQISGKEILKRIKIYQKFPEIALYEILKRSGILTMEKKRNLIEILKEKIVKSNITLSQFKTYHE